MIYNRIYTNSFAKYAVSWEVLMFWHWVAIGLLQIELLKAIYITCK